MQALLPGQVAAECAPCKYLLRNSQAHPTSDGTEALETALQASLAYTHLQYITPYPKEGIVLYIKYRMICM